MANELRVRDFQLPVFTLTADYDPGSDTTIEADELADYPVIDSTNHLAVWLNREGVGGDRPYLRYITAHSASATTATVGAAPENLVTPYAVATGVTGHHGSTPRDIVKAAKAERNSGDITITGNTSWANVDTGLDLVLPAFAGDLVQYTINGRWTATGAVEGYLDVGTLVSAAIVSYFGGAVDPSTGFGCAGWIGPVSTIQPFSGPLYHTLVSGDISSNTVTLRLRYRTASATNKSMTAGTNIPMTVGAVNYGPSSVAPVYS
jgi:hypothetical protein